MQGEESTSLDHPDTPSLPRASSAVEWTLEGSHGWLRKFALARMGVLLFMTVGSGVILKYGAAYLFALYVFALATNCVYIYTLRTRHEIGSSQTWAQVFVDFSVVALAVSLTDGPSSFFTFIFVLVVLEAGVLLGFAQGVVLATMAMVFMFILTWFYLTWYYPTLTRYSSLYELWYYYSIQVLLFYLTAFISGYWNSRIHRIREFQREILDNLNSGFVITNADGTIVLKNRAAEAILGGSGTGIGTRIEEAMRPLSGEECPVLIALRSGQDYTSYEFRIQHPDRASIMLGLTTNRLTTIEGELSGVIASVIDLTEVNAMRQELRRHDRMVVIGELAAGLAHEIRNPVAIIRGALDEMSTSAESPELVSRLKEMALKESDHLNDIVSGFLNFASDPTREQTPVELRELLLEVIELLRREFMDAQDLTIESAGLDGEYWVSGDASQLKQVFINIGKNAIEAMESVGTLSISIYQGSHGPIEINFGDTGPGIEPDSIVKVFEPFFTKKDSGVGMGLAVCMRIITAHNGTIRASNRKGGGCSMIMQFPPLQPGSEDSANEE